MVHINLHFSRIKIAEWLHCNPVENCDILEIISTGGVWHFHTVTSTWRHIDSWWENHGALYQDWSEFQHNFLYNPILVRYLHHSNANGLWTREKRNCWLFIYLWSMELEALLELIKQLNIPSLLTFWLFLITTIVPLSSSWSYLYLNNFKTTYRINLFRHKCKICSKCIPNP